MGWSRFVLVAVIVSVGVCAEDGAVNEETLDGNTRDIRQFDRQAWRAVDTYPDENAGWAPQEYPLDQFPGMKPKRRRIRKRKRRPIIQISPEDYNPEEPFLGRPLRRRIRPYRLEDNIEPWEETDEEKENKPRRRITPIFQWPEDTIQDNPTTTEETKINHAPSEAIDNMEVQNDEAVHKSSMNSISDLKSLLKQSGGKLSLSEILQQKNLSLSQLLSGNEKAISALTEKPQHVTEPIVEAFEEEPTTKFQRLPPSVGLKKNTDKTYEQEGESLETLTDKQMLDAQTKRLAILQEPRENKVFTTVTKFDVVTDATTERKIYVPAHPKYYKSIIFKPDIDSVNDLTTTAPQLAYDQRPSDQPARSESKVSLKALLPTTNAKIKTKPKVEPHEENYPLNFQFPTSIKINEVKGLEEAKVKALVQTNDQPLRMPIDLDVIIEKTTGRGILEELLGATELPVENMTYVKAKQEIMEILKDPVSRERLSRILEHRNMTLEELVQQRERGSSQVHLADIFHNKTKEPEPIEEPFVGQISPEVFNEVIPLGRQQKSQVFEPEIQPSVKTVEVVVTSTPKENLVTDLPTKKVNIESFAWKQLYPELFSDMNDNGLENFLVGHPYTTNDYTLQDINHVNHVETVFSSASNEPVSISDNMVEAEPFFRFPIGVKSAIIVSLAIIGLSLLVFLTILVIFRWSQKQKTSRNYCNSLSSKLTSPIIIQRRPTNAIKTFVNETLGRRKKNYFKSNVQSMCDDIWEGGMQRKPSF